VRMQDAAVTRRVYSVSLGRLDDSDYVYKCSGGPWVRWVPTYSSLSPWNSTQYMCVSRHDPWVTSSTNMNSIYDSTMLIHSQTQICTSWL